MPDRLLREGILLSRSVNKLSEAAENFYRRLMSVVDDDGACDPDPEYVASACYPLRRSKPIDEVVSHLNECVAAGLIEVVNDPAPMLVFLKLKKSDQKPPARRRPADPNFDDQRFVEFWRAYPRKENKPAAARAFLKIDPSPELLAEIVAAVARNAASESWTKSGGQFIPHAATWLNGRRWEDQGTTNGSPHVNGVYRVGRVGRAEAPAGKYDHLDSGLVTSQGDGGTVPGVPSGDPS